VLGLIVTVIAVTRIPDTREHATGARRTRQATPVEAEPRLQFGSRFSY
jgi:hypothetical protein